MISLSKVYKKPALDFTSSFHSFRGSDRMTQIAFGPCTQAISIPNGPFGIIALQDTDVILNPEFIFSAIVSLFEKNELRPFHLLDQAVLAMAMGAVTVTTTIGDASPGDMPGQGLYAEDGGRRKLAQVITRNIGTGRKTTKEFSIDDNP